MNGEAQRPRDYFATTRWTVVLSAARNYTERAGDSLAQLCQSYWYPLYAYVRRRGHSATDAEDLTQEFFARLLNQKKLAGISRDGGKFRSFLLTALNHFLVNEWKRAQTGKRGGGRVIAFDDEAAENRYLGEVANTPTPESAFDRAWALALLETVFNRLQQEYVADGKGGVFAELEFTLTGTRSSVPYAEVSARLKMSESAVKVAVHRLRQRYREVLRAEVAQTVAGPDEVEEELRDLLAALSE